MHLNNTKVIVGVFAGRRDRLPLLLSNLQTLVTRNVVHEIHLWDYCRDPEDAVWLRALPSMTPLTTSASYDYSPPRHLPATTTAYSFRVRGMAHNVHLLLQGSDGQEYELVVGGWDNTRSVFRAGRQSSHHLAETTDVLLSPETSDWTSVHLDWGSSPGKVRINNTWDIPMPCDTFTSVSHSSWWGQDGVYDFFEQTTPLRYCKPTHRWGSFYDHYARHAEDLYKNTVLVKCDDDVVGLQSDTFQQFINFRLAHPEFSLVFPNIINNGVCCYLQKQHGVHDLPTDTYMPQLGGVLWESVTLAKRLHDTFLENPAAFSYEGHTVIPQGHRVSINMFAVLSSAMYDLFTEDTGKDDEFFLTQTHHGLKAIYHGMYACHLSFHSQETPALEVPTLLTRYAALLPPVPPPGEPTTTPQDPESHGSSLPVP